MARTSGGLDAKLNRYASDRPLALRRPPPTVPRHFRCHGEEQALKLKLERLLDWLDRQLDDLPLEVEQRPDGRFVWLFDTIGYRVSTEHRCVVCFFKRDGLRVPQRRATLELLHPLCSRDWLPPILERLGLAEPTRQRLLFLNERERRNHNDWLAAAAWQRVRKDARFQRLRRQLLPSALGLDRELLAIALRSRAKPEGGVKSQVFNRVWQHEALFRQVMRENPRLLPLVSLAIEEELLAPGEDPVAGVRRVFMAEGLTPAGWRYVAAHGARLFREIWERAEPPALSDAIRAALRLEEAGLPPPPPRSVGFLIGWPGSPPEILGIVLRELRSPAQQQRYATFIDEARNVLDWASAAQPVLDERQRKAGWRWALRRAFAWGRQRALVNAQNGPAEWPSLVGAFQSDSYRVVPLVSVTAIVDEAVAMRNCMGTYIEECQRGAGRFFSIRSTASGKRLAVAYIDRTKARAPWTLRDVRGFANARASPEIWALATRIAADYAAVAEPMPRAIRDQGGGNFGRRAWVPDGPSGASGAPLSGNP